MTPIIGGTGVIRGSPESPNCSGGFQNALSTAVLGVSSKSTSWPASGLMRGPGVMMPARLSGQNLTMRMHMRRFTRLTNAFSKKLENHAAAIAFHYMHYNFCKIHQTLRVT